MYVVRFDKRDRIAHITFNRPDALNALNDQLNDELARSQELKTNGFNDFPRSANA
jgi:enoyl-CoA hydratase/carnithine racemase